jgi:hypothetical protein
MKLPAGCDDVPELLKKQFEAIDPNAPRILDLMNFEFAGFELIDRITTELKEYQSLAKTYESVQRQKEHLKSCYNQTNKLLDIVHVMLIHGICFGCKKEDIPLILDYARGHYGKHLFKKYNFPHSHISAAINKVRKTPLQLCSSMEFPFQSKR